MAASQTRKKATKQTAVLEVLRGEILDGTFRPKSRLPSQSQIAQRFKVSTVTAHLATTRLAQEGFVYSRKRAGTFVTEKPPHLNNYALVFPTDPVSPTGERWSRYYLALANEAVNIEQTEGRRMLLFHGVDRHVDNDDRQRLMSYIESKRLGGMIFANVPIHLEGTPILDQPAIPRVGLMSLPGCGMPAVGFDNVMWVTRALGCLAAQRRKRIAILMLGRFDWTDPLIAELAGVHGLECPPYWRHKFTLSNADEAANLVHLLMHRDSATRPDGLVIADDNIVEHALIGLVTAGVRVPDDVAVVAHCNYPWPPPSVLPVTRLGFSIGQALRTCLDVLDRQRRGEPVPPSTRLPALFEAEAVQVVHAPVA